MTSKIKQHIRRTLNAQCRQLSPEERIKAATHTTQKLLTLPVFINSQHIACYQSTPVELDTTPLIEAIVKAPQKKCYLPVIHPSHPHTMNFIHYTVSDRLIPNRFNILEPPYDETREIAPHALDLVILPLRAFDNTLTRLGAGGGYYDKTFQFSKHDQSLDKKPILCGFCYDFQEVKFIPRDAWDIKLDVIITEKRILFS